MHVAVPDAKRAGAARRGRNRANYRCGMQAAGCFSYRHTRSWIRSSHQLEHGTLGVSEDPSFMAERSGRRTCSRAREVESAPFNGFHFELAAVERSGPSLTSASWPLV